MAKPPPRARVDAALYATLRAIYHFERSLCERFGVDYQEICLLQLARRRRGLRVGDAARALEIPLFSATRLIKRLEALCYVSKRRDEADGRVFFVELQAEGEALLERIERENYRLVSANARRLTGQELEGFVVAAARMDELLGVAGRSDEEP